MDGSDSGAEDTFLWGDATAVDALLFQPEEPDNGGLPDGAEGEEDCLVLTAQSQLSDRPCLHTSFFICELSD